MAVSLSFGLRLSYIFEIGASMSPLALVCVDGTG